MARIKKLHINNFKFFDQQDAIDLNSKHLLLFGENGSGKSTLYWSLYTLFEAAIKSDRDEIKKYFRSADVEEQSLVNIHAQKIEDADGVEHFNSFISVESDHDTPITYKISLKDQDISGDQDAIEINQASDFINYKVLYKLQDFWNGKPMDLANIFKGYVLPYVKFPEAVILRNRQRKTISNAQEMWDEIVEGPGYTTNPNGKQIQVYKNSPEYTTFEAFVNTFNEGFQRLIDFVNLNAPEIILKLGYDIKFQLDYQPATWSKGKANYYLNDFSIRFKITRYLGRDVTVHRPQSFLNEAKITAISLAIRLTILKQRVNEEAGDILKFLVFDDAMISLDMNNRDRFMDFLFDPENGFLSDYQVLFLTHDKPLYAFVADKIKQYDNPANWVFKEMYVGLGKGHESPEIIDSHLTYRQKAKKYFDAHDYVASSLYIRKEIEKLVVERLPREVVQTLDSKPKTLEALWRLLKARFSDLDEPIDTEIQNHFDQTKLMVLNPQAHHNLTEPVYKLELEKAFGLLDKLEGLPIPSSVILLSAGMELKFSHPTLDYTWQVKLLSDLKLDRLGTQSNFQFPYVQITNWQYEGKENWSPQRNAEMPADLVAKVKANTKERLPACLRKLKDDTVLGITDELFVSNLKLLGSLWTLDEVLGKSGIDLVEEFEKKWSEMDGSVES
jgi:energy-coupling factor transporter ATP-binding protein EcfA2